MLEAAIVMPLLVLLTFGIVEFSSVFYVYLALENGVGQATRFAVTGATLADPDTGAPLSREGSIRAAMRRATPTLTIDDAAFSFQHMAPGAAGWTGGAGGSSDIEKVSVDYTWTLLTPWIRPFFPGGEVNLRVDSTMKNEGGFE
jgi:Flp pilus assembly protein TadG